MELGYLRVGKDRSRRVGREAGVATEAVGRSLALGRGSGSHLRMPNGYRVFKDCPEHDWLAAWRGQRPEVSVVAQEPHGTWQQGGQGEGCQVHRDPCVAGEKLELPPPRFCSLPTYLPAQMGPRSSLPGEDTFFRADTMAEKLVLSLSSSWGEFQ